MSSIDRLMIRNYGNFIAEFKSPFNRNPRGGVRILPQILDIGLVNYFALSITENETMIISSGEQFCVKILGDSKS